LEPIKIAVRKIVEQVMRSGDIDNRYADSSAMYAGASAHRRIQRSMGENYQKEVSLSLEAEIDGESVIVQGRADGVITLPDGGIVIDEIKTTSLPLERFRADEKAHLGQAKCYAHMYLRQAEEKHSRIGVQLTYCQMETGEIQRQSYSFTAEELEEFFAGLLEDYGVFIRFEREWKQTRDSSIKATPFPYPSYRKGQREMAVAVYRTIEHNKKLYVQAATGIGKTLSALFPSIKALGESLGEKIFYLTAKTVTRTAAEDAVRLMAEKGLRVKSVTLRAKDKICPFGAPGCNPDFCEYAEGHYDRVNGAILDILENNDLITPEITAEYSNKHRVCPHETALDVALWSDVIVGDYNHVFDPTVYLRRFFSENEGGGESGGYIFLIDEAHNLADRVRDMYTAKLSKSQFLKLKNEIKDKAKETAGLKRAAGEINKYLLEVRKALGAERRSAEKELDAEFLTLVNAFIAAAEDWLPGAGHSGHNLHEEVLTLYFEALMFAGLSEIYNGCFISITDVFGSEASRTLFCLDPSEIISRRLEKARAAVMFSATLTPLPYYREILGGDEEDFILGIPSPFDRERLFIAADYGVSTKYADRENSRLPIAEAVYAAVSRQKGNYMAFFPSYEYMAQVYETFTGRYGEINTIVQKTGMSEEERRDFLLRFDAENSETLLGFCVLGGIFSEGIDLVGGRLIGSIIVGVGMPKLSFRQDLIKDYFNEKNGRGFDFAYVFPGMNKVLQAAGRVIRAEEDSGTVLLIDSRFNTPKYRTLFPDHWSHIKMIKNADELEQLNPAHD